MSFAVPSALAFALIALPIIVFYILKVRLRQVPVSTNMFWKQIFDEKPPRSIWQKVPTFAFVAGSTAAVGADGVCIGQSVLLIASTQSASRSCWWLITRPA